MAKNSITFLVYGRYALFTDPITHLGGEKCSYHIPTYEALKGIVKSIYWKPTLIWYIKRVRIMKPFRTQTRSMKPIAYDQAGNTLSIYTCLADVAYQVEACFEWNTHRPELEHDRIDGKHYEIAKRMLAKGGRCILVPRFTAKSYSKLITKYKCNFIAGVPTLYEALLRLPNMKNADLSNLKGVFSGGDSLSIELKKKFDQFLAEHKATIRIREGYGTTECVTASCLTPVKRSKEGSIGIPFPDTYYKIVKPGTDEELPYGEEGEIVLAGPTVMAGYYGKEEETARTLRKHADGMTWLYTGDLGSMDDEGFIYFKGRIKRMIITSGYNVYPAQLENILDANEKVQMSCVIGVPDPYKMQKVKAFVMLKPGIEPAQEVKEELLAYCRKYIAKYAMPYDIEFRKELPKTLVGKVAYRVLEEEEMKKRDGQEK